MTGRGGRFSVSGVQYDSKIVFEKDGDEALSMDDTDDSNRFDSRRSDHTQRIRRGGANTVFGVAAIALPATIENPELCAQNSRPIRRHCIEEILQHRTHTAADLDAIPAELSDLGDRPL
jgi:hypothetical protein